MNINDVYVVLGDDAAVVTFGNYTCFGEGFFFDDGQIL